ncbi:protein SHORT INTERNODES 1-like [Phragmites australis]|uniref:protein SHORT INTERNODES 1-like n=1 Tax=Phragmites australis TaxID=29695 RepID=UPI002D787734|nr:protein SHORT INTERNODES 1-like [Phragmites australis]XP_062227751.1 protein SHORT INTERNODES 1-like [Phragmites australis]
MAGFSLRGGGGGGGGRGGDRGGDHPIGADSLFLYARGAAAAAAAADTAGSGGGGGGIGFQLWHPHQQAAAAAPHTSQFFTSGVATGVVLGFSPHDGGGGIGGAGGGGAGGGRAGTSCQDCGNNAKKDCSHMRCRTCCRSRGFNCPTHIKSTWVPAAKRRDRQQQLAALFRGAANNSASATAAVAAASKRPRELARSLGRLPSATSAMVATTTSSGDGSGGRFPPELSVEAVFRCVRIGAVDEQDAELAYQTAVSIGGHTFKGILRDHGPADDAAVGQLPPSSTEYHQLTQGREGSSPAGSSEAAATAATSAAVLMDPYPTPIGAFAAGTQFFPHNPRT